MKVHPAPHCPSCGAQVLPPPSDPLKAAFLRGVRAGLERAARLDIRVSPNSPDEKDSLKADITNEVWKQIHPHLQRAFRAIDPESVKDP